MPQIQHTRSVASDSSFSVLTSYFADRQIQELRGDSTFREGSVLFRRLAIVFFGLSAPLLAQLPVCSLPPIQVASAKGNFFTEAQESQLGDVIAEQWHQRISIVHDDALTQHLREIGNKVVAQLPTTMTYHFELIDLGEANAFSLPGGRIYISRKIVALARSDDELAGLLAHELGHEVTHQGAAMLSRMMHELLGINGVTGPDDIRARYNQLLDKQARSRIHADNEEDDQLTADSVALQAMTRAGYNPAAFATLFNRLAETNNGKSSFFSDLFGATAPTVARAKKLQKLIATFPAACAQQQAPLAAFIKWQEQVVNYDGRTVAQSALPGLLWQRKLDPTLRPDIRFIRYSRDGKNMLVQDSGAIEVLTHEPLAPLFQIPAPDARRAQFSPDGQEISFFIGTSDPRVETWSVSTQKRLAVHELHIKHECLESQLSSDGKFFACVSQDIDAFGMQFTLALYDVLNGQELFRSKDWLQANGWNAVFLELQLLVSEDSDTEPLPLIFMQFSPDGRYFVAGREGKLAAFDLGSRSMISLPGALKSKLGNGFIFLGPDRVLTRKEIRSAIGEVQSFPDGKMLKEGVTIGGGYMDSTVDPRFAILHITNSKNFSAGLLDLAQNKFVVGLKTNAGDVWNGEIATERVDGEIVVSTVGETTAKARVQLPESPLGTLHVVNASADFNWLALSDHQRGAVWDLNTGKRRFLLFGFDGASFSSGFLHTDMPKRGDLARSIVHMRLEGDEAQAHTVTGNDFIEQRGPVLLVMKADPKSKVDFSKPGTSSRWVVRNMRTLEIHDVVSDQVLWSRAFPKPLESMYVDSPNDSITFVSRDKDNFVLDVRQLSTGNAIANLAVSSNKDSISLRHAFAAGDYIFVSDNEHRVTLYNKSGAQVTRVFGSYATASSSLGVLAASSEDQALTLYESVTGRKLQTLRFPQYPMFYRFDASGQKLLVLTSDETVYAFDVNKLKQAPVASGN